MTRQDLVVRLDDIIERLSGPLPEAELRHGWTEQSRKAMGIFFTRMRGDVVAGKDLKSFPEYVGLVRGLDHWGIGGGELFRAAAELGSLATRA
jgi:hypothetical protein